jgi:hypothetical protein
MHEASKAIIRRKEERGAQIAEQRKGEEKTAIILPSIFPSRLLSHPPRDELHPGNWPKIKPSRRDVNEKDDGVDSARRGIQQIYSLTSELARSNGSEEGAENLDDVAEQRIRPIVCTASASK